MELLVAAGETLHTEGSGSELAEGDAQRVRHKSGDHVGFASPIHNEQKLLVEEPSTCSKRTSARRSPASKEAPGRETTTRKWHPKAVLHNPSVSGEQGSKGASDKVTNGSPPEAQFAPHARISRLGSDHDRSSVRRSGRWLEGVSDLVHATSLEELFEQKAALKRRMRQWETDYENANGGLVPTHSDKKEDESYRDLKAHGKQVEAALAAKRNAAALAGETLRRPVSSLPPRSGMEFLTDFTSESGLGSEQQSDLHGAARSRGPASVEADPLSLVQVPHVFFEEVSVEVTPALVALLTLLTALPYAAFVTAFSIMGAGEAFYESLATRGSLWRPLTLTAALLLLLLYLLDVSYWERPLLVWTRRILLSTAASLVCIGALLATDEYPYGPLLIFFLIAPAYWWVIYAGLYTTRHLPAPTFLRALCTALLSLSTAAASIWLGWVLAGNNWDDESKAGYMMAMRACCLEPEALLTYLGYEHNASLLLRIQQDAFSSGGVSTGWVGVANASIDLDQTVVSHGGISWLSGSLDGDGVSVAWVSRDGCVAVPSRPCMTVLLFWASPFITAAVGVVAAGVAFTLARQLMHQHMSHSGITAGPRLIIMGLTISAAALWVAAQLAGASMGMSRVVVLGAVTLLLVLGVLAHRFFGFNQILASIMVSQPLARALMKAAYTSDAIKALGILFLSPVVLLVLLLSAANQFVRVHLLRVPSTAEARRSMLTPRVRALLLVTSRWNWTGVLRFTILGGLLLLTLQVGVMKVTVVFMSWLVKVLKPLHVAVSTTIFSLIGLCMFLLPPVPGAPVYLASGVLLTAVVEDSLGFYGAMCYAMLVSLAIKLVACTMQQKLIGESLGRYPSIRRLVNINAPVMRAIKVLMSRPGCSMGKVATLVGGPDWPTSVLMGIMGMPLAPILLGTTPVIFLIAPMAFSGGFMTRGPEAPYPALMNIAISLSTLTQTGAFFKMAQLIERTTFEARDEIKALPYDEQVLALDTSRAAHERLLAEITHWNSGEMPRYVRAALIAGAVLVTLAYQAQLLFSARCFRDFALYPDFDTQLREELGGKLHRLVMPHGWFLMVAALASYACLRAYTRWARRYVKAQERSGRQPHNRSEAAGHAADPREAGGRDSGLIGEVTWAPSRVTAVTEAMSC